MSENCWILSEMTSYTWLGCCAATFLLYPTPLDRMLGEGIQMLVLQHKFRPGKAAAQQLFYYIRPQLDRMLGEGILMLVLYINSGPGRLLRSNYSIISGPTGQDARGGDPHASSVP